MATEILDQPDMQTPDADEPAVNLSAEKFPQITKRFAETPHTAFNDPNYYKTALSGEGESARRLHGIVTKYLNCKDPRDKSVFRQQLIVYFWNFLMGAAKKAPGRLPDPKKYLLRFGILHPTFISEETRAFFAKLVVENELAQPIYYLDEWLKAVGTGAIGNSAADEAPAARNNSARFQQLLDKAQGKLEGSRTLLKAKDQERTALEQSLQERINIILEHSPLTAFPDVNAVYSENQKQAFSEIQELLKGLLKTDRDLDLFLKDYYQAEETVGSLQDKIEAEGGAVEMDVQAVDTEFGTVRQMVKMTVGRQGNHFPILSAEYFHSGFNDIGYRENVLSILSFIESIDPEVFCRLYKNRVNRIAPYVILLPTYGDTGICWEPFNPHNRATSRGRIAIPMYPKSLLIAALSAVGDLRWQTAKEKASYYWMEEGLTGNYYQWFDKMKLKGDVKEFFIQDYITWITRESEGTQKLDKEIRGVFWRYMPFSQPVKEKLKTRNLIYQELYQRDINRTMSDGY
ncbi:hypothetical protein FACS189450_03770 [Spirochaetia bacterium]|nr:hypothetical protein FACS189450_03770 [Spirochaetia bacterium]